ncbi:MAG: substrate-binding domain-containing protein [Solobacterium sp.]|nr:substrate-binding domain-containing protein [Solobacterium sp.]
MLFGIMGFVENQWSNMLTDGMKAACDDYGVEYVYGNYNNDDSKIPELLNTWTTMGVDAVVSSPSTTVGVGPYLEASENGVHQAICNTGFSEGDVSFVDVYMIYTQEDLAAANVDYAVEFIKNMDEEPVIAVIGYGGFAAIDIRYDAWISEINKKLGTNYSAVAEAGSGQADFATTATTDILTAHPEVNIIYATYEAVADGAIAAIDSLGLRGKVHVFAVDCSEQMCDFMLEDDPILIGCASQDPFLEGYQTTEHMIKILAGEEESCHGEITYLKGTSVNCGDIENVKKYKEYLQSFSNN